MCLKQLVLATLSTVALTLAVPAGATGIGDEGCTPGYWKNHTDSWIEDASGLPSYFPTEEFGNVFSVSYGDVTLLEALQGGGGPGISGAKQILARAAVAALLNAAHDELSYPLRRYQDTPSGPAIIPAVQDVWDSGDRAAILELATFFDGLNNLGCPLN